MNEKMEHARDEYIATILAEWESSVPEIEKDVAKRIAGRDADTITVVANHPSVLMPDSRWANAFANSPLWRPLWAAYLPIARIAIKSVNERLLAKDVTANDSD